MDGIEYLAYGKLPKEPDYMEVILYRSRAPIDHDRLEAAAKARGYVVTRYATVDLSIPPDFDNTVS